MTLFEILLDLKSLNSTIVTQSSSAQIVIQVMIIQLRQENKHCHLVREYISYRFEVYFTKTKTEREDALQHRCNV